MPLSELVCQLAEGQKFDSSQEKNINCLNDQSSQPGNDFVELIWENGQIQFNRARKIQTSDAAEPQTLKKRNRDTGNGSSNTKIGRFGAMDSVLDEVSMSVPSADMGLNQDNDMVPWLNYPVDDSLQQDYCHDYFTELSGITMNENSQNSFATLDKKSSVNQSVGESDTMSVHNGSSFEQGHVLRVSSAWDGNATRPRDTASYLDSSSSQQGQTSFAYSRSQVSANNDEGGNNLTHLASPQVLIPPSGGGEFPSFLRQFPASPSTNSGLMNFSCFTRPAALAKSNLQNVGANDNSEISSIERIRNKDKGATPCRSKPGESMLLSSHSISVTMSSKVDSKQLKTKPAVEPVSAKKSVTLDREVDCRNDKNHFQFAESANKGFAYGEKTEEAMVASSVCSGNSVERASDEPTENLKKKHRETEESEGPGEDIEAESVGGKKAAPGQGGAGSKRSRAAEVHNLSERRRRDRINEKMRALQELIPNCNKVDKASMLDEAIEYLKTLQLQVQIMSMGAGLYMPSMMLPPGMPQMRAAQMTQFSSMAVGMGMGFGMGMPDLIGGSSGCSVIQVPPGAYFPGPPVSGPSALLGMGASNMHMFGISSQGHPMAYPCAPLTPIPRGSPLRTTLGMNAGSVPDHIDNSEPALGSGSNFVS